MEREREREKGSTVKVLVSMKISDPPFFKTIPRFTNPTFLWEKYEPPFPFCKEFEISKSPFIKREFPTMLKSATAQSSFYETIISIF